MFWIDEIHDYSETFAPVFLQLKRNFAETGTVSLWRWDIFSGVPLFGDPVTMLLYPLNLLALFIDPLWLFPLLIVASFFIGAMGAGKVLYSLGISRYRAIFFGIMYMLMPLSIAHVKVGHINLYEAFSLCPWIFYFLIRWVKTKNLRYILGASIAHMYVLFTHPTMFFIVSIFLFLVYLIFKPRIQLRIVFFYILSVVFLGAAFLLPTIEFSTLITRTNLQSADIVPVWTAKSFAGGLFFPYPKIDSLDQEAILYPGILLSVFAAVGWWSLKKYRISLLGILLLALLLSMGNATPLYEFILRVMPYENILRVSTRFWYIGIWILLVCAAIGSQKIKKRSFSIVLMTMMFIELLTFASLRLGLPGRYGKIEPLHFYDTIENSHDTYRIYATTRDLRQGIIAQKRATLADGEYPLQLKSYISELASAGGYDYQEYSVMHPPYQVFDSIPQPNAEKLGMLNVQYVVSSYPLNDSSLTHIGSEKDLLIYKNTAFKPLVWSDNAAITSLQSIVRGNYSKSTYSSDRAGVVKVGIPWYPGWEYTLDNRIIDVDRFNSYIEFDTPVGNHVLEATFENSMYLRGLKVTTMMLLVLAVLLVYMRKRAL